MRTDCNARRPDLTLEDTSKKTIILIAMLCPNEYNKIGKRDVKIGKYYRGIKELKGSIRQIFEYDNNDKKLEWISREMQKTLLWESESLIRKVLSGPLA